MKSENVLIFSLTYYPFVGGAEVAWKEITDRISTFEFDMVVAKMDRKLPDYEKVGNVHVYRIGFGVKFLDKILYCLLAPVKAFFLNRKRNYIAHIGLMASYGGLASVFYKFFNSKPAYILNLQDGDTDEYIASKTKHIQWLYKKIFSQADIVTVIASFLGKRALDNGFSGSIQLIPNGVDIEKFTSYRRNAVKISEIRNLLWVLPDEHVIISTSRLNYKNAIEDIVLSLEHLPKKYKFVCLGEWEERPKLESLLEEHGLKDRCILFGYVDHKEILDYLSIADYFCRPSLQEWLGNSFLEAMAFELPVVATPVWGIVDFLIDGETGYFCQVKDPKSIAEAVLKFDQDPEVTKIILKNAKEMVVARYNWDNIAKSYEALFTEIQYR